MSKNEKKQVLSAALALTIFLSGCGSTKKAVGDKNFLYNSTITYKNDAITGNVIAENMEFIKILTFTVGDSTFTKLVGLNTTIYDNGAQNDIYIDLDNGTTLINKTTKTITLNSTNKDYESTEYKIGSDLTIVSEERIIPYLLEAGMFEDEYDINEIISFYHENIEPNYEPNQKLTLEK